MHDNEEPKLGNKCVLYCIHTYMYTCTPVENNTFGFFQLLAFGAPSQVEYKMYAMCRVLFEWSLKKQQEQRIDCNV